MAGKPSRRLVINKTELRLAYENNIIAQLTHQGVKVASIKFDKPSRPINVWFTSDGEPIYLED